MNRLKSILVIVAVIIAVVVIGLVLTSLMKNSNPASSELTNSALATIPTPSDYIAEQENSDGEDE